VNERERRLKSLEVSRNRTADDLQAAKERLEEIRRRAERANRAEDPPLFEIAEDGVFCLADGLPVTDPHQIICERLYWMEVDRDGPGLIFDEDREEFYTQAGELALSRSYVHLEHIMGDRRMDAWEAEAG
jgi:hypothetical protein